MPKWAKCMPQNEPPMRPGLLSRSTTCCKLPRPTHMPRKTPNMVPADQLPSTKGSTMANNNAAPPTKRKRQNTSLIRASRQCATVPGTSTNSSGTMRGANTRLKYGGPTDNLPMFKASMISGYKVPSNTAPVATTSKTLLSNKKDSRETKPMVPPKVTAGARQANRVSEAPTTTAKKIRIKIPREGSDANACTEVSTPERTKKVPSKDSEKAAMAKSTVHALKLPRFSVTIKEWMRAVPTNQGISEAFSTGSQNHQPPQPNS